MQQAIEDFVTAFIEAKLAQGDDSPEDVASDCTPVVIDAEALQRLVADAPELGDRSCTQDADVSF